MKTILLILVLMFLPNPFDGVTTGAYYYDLNFYWCSHRSACIHEIGHLLDDRGGMVSQSDEFIKAIDYAGEDIKACYLCVGEVAEAYAVLYQRAEGQRENMPENIQRFYDWDLGMSHIERIN